MQLKNLLLYRGEHFDSNFYYFSGVDIDHSLFLQKGAQKILFVPEMNQQLATKLFNGRVMVYKKFSEDLKHFLRIHSLPVLPVVSADLSSISAALADRLRKICKLQDASLVLLRIRAKKRFNEVEKIKKAVKITKQIFTDLNFKSAKTEMDLKKQILVHTAELGLEPAFEPMIATDKNSGFPHYKSQNKKLGSFVLIDYGVCYEHYCSDLTRCFILDGDSKKQQEYEKLKEVCYALIDALPDLRIGKQLAKFASNLIKKAGMPAMIHSIGHGVGLDIHELPRLGVKSTDLLTNSTLAIEPAFYGSKYGMRYEETVHFDGRKAWVL